MIFGGVQRGEVLEIGFNLRPVCDLETNRSEQCLDPFQRTGNWVQSTFSFAASRQGYIKGFLCQAIFKRLASEVLASRVERGLDGFFRFVDRSAGRFLIFWRQLYASVRWAS